jgi:transcriptional regulator with XRE-family HTH domain
MDRKYILSIIWQAVIPECDFWPVEAEARPLALLSLVRLQPAEPELRRPVARVSDVVMLDKIDERLGARVRIEREIRGWSLTELAKRSGVSRAMIHKVERGEASPTAMLLARLSGAFEISMSTLMVRAEMQEGLLLRKDDQPVWIDPVTGYARRHVSPRSVTPIDVIDVDFPPGKESGFPASSYANRKHLVWVLAGELVFIEGGVRHEMREGDCLELGPPNDCIFRNETAEPCRYAVIVLREA